MTTSRRAVLTACCCLVLLVVVYLLAVWTVPGQRFEDAVLEDAQRVAGGRQEEAALAALGTISRYSLAGVLLLVCAVALVRRSPLLAVAGAAVIGGSVVTTEVLRHLVLLRPILLPSGVRRDDQSFPSGHTAVAMSVMCALVLVIPHRFRWVVVLPTSAWATAVGASTVTANWHRPSDTIGSDLIVLAYACAAVAFLVRVGATREAEPLGPLGRVAMRLLIGLHVTGAVAGLAVAVLSAPGGDGDPAALRAGRAIALAGGATVAVTMLGLLRRTDLGPAPRGRPPMPAPPPPSGPSAATHPTPR
jgi:membrane-associated phospholipid phosphatase